MPPEDPIFELFWQAYPRKVDKISAKKAWQRASFRVEAVLSGLEKWKREWAQGESRFIPYPSTFLNQRRWEHPPEPDDYSNLIRKSIERVHQRMGQPVSPPDIDGSD